jgi:DtxR family Mn-dependent transcriptional regulator
MVKFGGNMNKEDVLSESMEDYLETILALETTKKVARVKDIANKLNVQRGSVTGALKTLEQKGLINYEPYSYITLTKEGNIIASKITRRHKIIKDFLERIVQLSSDNADAMACRMEHTVDEQSMDKIINFIEFIDNCPRAGQQWIDAFINFCSSERPQWNKCMKCINDCKKRHEHVQTDIK